MPAPKAKRLYWREILPGDRKKIAAASNTSKTGGGARDLRFPDAHYRPTLLKMFPQDANGRGDRPIRRGTLVWDEAGGQRSQSIDYWPATKARPTEGRIARLNSMPPVKSQLPPPKKDDRVVMLLIQEDTGNLRVRFAQESSLRSGNWHEAIAGPILAGLDAPKGRRTPQGAIELKGGV